MKTKMLFVASVLVVGTTLAAGVDVRVLAGVQSRASAAIDMFKVSTGDFLQLANLGDATVQMRGKISQVVIENQRASVITVHVN